MGNGKRKTGKRKHKMGNRNWKWNTDQSSPVVKIILYCFYFSLTHLYRTWNLVKLLNLSLETGQRLLQGERSSWDNSTDCSSSSSWETISSSIFNSLFPPPRGETFSCFQAYKFPLRTWFPHSLKRRGEAKPDPSFSKTSLTQRFYFQWMNVRSFQTLHSCMYFLDATLL